MSGFGLESRRIAEEFEYANVTERNSAVELAEQVGDNIDEFVSDKTMSSLCDVLSVSSKHDDGTIDSFDVAVAAWSIISSEGDVDSGVERSGLNMWEFTILRAEFHNIAELEGVSS